MNKSRITTAIALMLLATPAFAHPGHMEHGFSSGVLHPLTGLDHLMMLLSSVTVHREDVDNNSSGSG